MWQPAKQYIEEQLHVDPKKEPYAFDRYDPGALAGIVETQFKLADLQKRQGKHVYGVLIVLDDFADDPAFYRNEKLVHSLFVRGRHAFISTCVSTQKLTAVAPVIRVNCSALFVFRLRSFQDLDTLIDEFSALVESKKVLLELYRRATSERFGFLYIDLTAHDVNEMFFSKFSTHLIPKPIE